MSAPAVSTGAAAKVLAPTTPFPKWVGGKQRIVNVLLQHAPATFNNYWEGLCGSAALYFALLNSGHLDRKQTTLADLCPELIITYQAIRDDVEAVIANLSTHINEEHHFYRIRALDPQLLPPSECAARMIFLHQTCQRGLYRVNQNDKFNASFGKRQHVTICDPENLRQVSQSLQGTVLQCGCFSTVLQQAQKGDLVYLDPPYVDAPGKSKSFAAYTAKGFGQNDHELIASTFEELARRGVLVMASNRDTPWVRHRYSAFRQIPVAVVHKTSTDRTPVGELIIVSY